jgi:hypothetical protein
LRVPSFTDETGMGVCRLETTKSAIKMRCATKVGTVQDLVVLRGFGTVRSAPDGQVRLKYAFPGRSLFDTHR